MEYEVYYKLNDRTDMYYVSFSHKKLSNGDILYSINLSSTYKCNFLGADNKQ